MKTFKFLTILLVTSFIGFTSCQKEIDEEIGQDPNTNSPNSVTANHIERTSMYDGSFDNFLDGNSCSSILFPVTSVVNDEQITLTSTLDYELVLDALTKVTTDKDVITFQFPIRVKLSNHSETVINNQAELDALKDSCERAEEANENAIQCIDFVYPITLLTFDVNLEQTNSAKLTSDAELFAYMNHLGTNKKFAIRYPITVTLNNATQVSINSDAELATTISNCLAQEEEINEAEEAAEEEAKNLETILINGTFKVQSYIESGVENTNNYANYTLDFANNLTCSATYTIDTLAKKIKGTFKVTANAKVIFTLNFTNNTTFEMLNNTWKVTSFTNGSITLQSTANANTTLIFSQV